MRINKNKMKKRVIHYDGEQNLNKTNKWRERKQTVIAYYWLFGSSIWKAVAEITWGGGGLIWQHSSVWEKADHMGYMLRPVFCHIPAMDNYILNKIKDFWTGVNISHQLFLQYSVRILKVIYAAPPLLLPLLLLPLSSPYLRWESPFTVASEPRSAIWDLGVFFWRLVWMEAVAC